MFKWYRNYKKTKLNKHLKRVFAYMAADAGRVQIGIIRSQPLHPGKDKTKAKAEKQLAIAESMINTTIAISKALKKDYVEYE